VGSAFSHISQRRQTVRHGLLTKAVKYSRAVKKNNEDPVVPHAADHLLRHATLQCFFLMVVNNKGNCRGVHLYFLKLLTQHYKLNDIKSTGEIKKCDPHRAACFVQMRVGSLKQVEDVCIH